MNVHGVWLDLAGIAQILSRIYYNSQESVGKYSTNQGINYKSVKSMQVLFTKLLQIKMTILDNRGIFSQEKGPQPFFGISPKMNVQHRAAVVLALELEYQSC